MRWDVYRQERLKLIDKAVTMIKQNRKLIEIVVQIKILRFILAIHSNFKVLMERRKRK